MSIIRVDPPLEGSLPGTRISIESDAANNLSAIAEIEDWCFENGCERVNEGSLILHGDPLVFLGHCYVPYL